MKILFIAAKFYPNIGGVQKHVYHLSQELIKMGHSVTVITEGFGSNHTGKNEEMITDDVLYSDVDGIDVYYMNFGPWGFAKKFRIWAKMIQSRNLVKEADIVHCHDVFFWYLPLRFMFWFKPVFTTFHGYESYPPRKRAIFIRRLSEKLSWGSILIGDFIKKWYGTQGDIVLYGAVEKPKKAFHSKKKDNKKSVNILILGRLDADVGMKTYLETLAKLKEQKVPFTLTVCGDGSYKDAFASYGDIHGFVENVDDYIRKADVVFGSSYLVAFEALSYRKLMCAVYENPMKKDYLTMAPFHRWIVISNKADTLVSKLHKHMKNSYVLQNEDEIAQFIDDHTWQKAAEKYIALWHEKILQ